ncbi:hypothetical protein [Streptomyces sp. NPDC045470]
MGSSARTTPTTVRQATAAFPTGGSLTHTGSSLSHTDGNLSRTGGN